MKYYYSRETLFFKLVSELAICLSKPSFFLSFNPCSLWNHVGYFKRVHYRFSTFFEQSHHYWFLKNQSYHLGISLCPNHHDSHEWWQLSEMVLISLDVHQRTWKDRLPDRWKEALAVYDLNYAIWDAENSMAMTWLVNSMEEDIDSNYMCYPTTQEL